MNNARYVFRMDDITPTMDWQRFWALLRLFQRYHVKPLLGVVPDNRDHALDLQDPHPQFWDIINLLVERNSVDVAQHGYQHVLDRQPLPRTTTGAPSPHDAQNLRGTRSMSSLKGFKMAERSCALTASKQITSSRRITRSTSQPSEHFALPASPRCQMDAR